MDYKKIGGGYVDRVHLAQDTDEWRAVVSMVMKLRGYLRKYEFLKHCCMELARASDSQRTLEIVSS